MKIVVDTNVLVAALINPYGSPAGVLNCILSNRVCPCFDARIIDEYERVLQRPRFGFVNINWKCGKTSIGNMEKHQRFL